MLEYCTWLTKAAGDKQESLSLWSHSMFFFRPQAVFVKYSSQAQNEWVFSHIAQQKQTLRLLKEKQTKIKSFKRLSKRYF